MAKKEVTDKNIKEIKKLLKSKELVIGTDRTLKNLQRGNIKKIFMASNCPERVRLDISHYSKFNNVDVVELQYANEELGVFCKKPFSISVISILKKQEGSL